jgi:error-prone DNA polymerase
VTQPKNFYDLVVEIALVRPGPNVGEMKSPYIQRRENAQKGMPYIFDDPVTEKILGRTFGIPIFQEQVMKLAIEKAGFSPGEADQLRRAIAAWRSADAVDALSGRFYEGLIRGGMSQEKAQELFGYMKGFSAYGFPESHAASFAILSYLSAWIKFYHPAELLCGLINSQPMGFYPIDVLMNDAIRHGVRVLPVDVNLSDWDAKMEEGGAVRMGFRTIQGMRKQDGDALCAERQRSRFSSIHDFLARTYFRRDLIETMAMADVFSSFGLDQRHSFWASIELRSMFEQKNSEQLSLFERGDREVAIATTQAFSVFSEMKLSEAIAEDYRGLGYSLRGNGMKGFRSEFGSLLPKRVSTEVKACAHGERVVYAGVILVLQRPPTAKGVAFITLEDEFGSVDGVLFKGVYERYRSEIRSSQVLIITGKVERRGKSVSVLVDSCKGLSGTSI